MHISSNFWNIWQVSDVVNGSTEASKSCQLWKHRNMTNTATYGVAETQLHHREVHPTTSVVLRLHVAYSLDSMRRPPRGPIFGVGGIPHIVLQKSGDG
jgi:hypothetical protein